MLSFIWIGFAFILGLVATKLRLPPLIGYLVAGFALNFLGYSADQSLKEFSDLGISLLLFTIGLKLNLSTLVKKEVLGVSLFHSICGFLFFFLILFLGFKIQTETAAIIAFAFTFSSTVYVFKILEDRGDFFTTYGKTAIGILIIQDILAVIFMVATATSLPSLWLLLVLASLWPLKFFVHRLLDKIPRGELLIFFGLSLTLGGVFLFELANIKGDLGALVVGVLLSKHQRSGEVGKALLSLKNLFLLGFFLSVGMLGLPSLEQCLIAFAFCLLLPLRSVLYFILFTRAGLRSRTSFLAASSLFNYSEFGLIVGAVSVSAGWLDSSWLTVLALSLSFSFIASAFANIKTQEICSKHMDYLKSFEKENLHYAETSIRLGNANVMILGLGRVGTGALHALIQNPKWQPIGFDVNEEVIASHLEKGFNVQHGNATNPDFWTRIELSGSTIELILLAMPLASQNMIAAKYLRDNGFRGKISSIAKYSNEIEDLKAAGVDSAFNLYDEAGVGFAQNTTSLYETNT